MTVRSAPRAFRLLCCFLCCAPAAEASFRAQTETDKETAKTAEQPASTDQDEVLTYHERIVVTASRVEEALIDAPATMSVVTSDTIERSPGQNYGDLLRSVPGASVVQTSARDVNLVSRGAASTLTTSQLALLDGRSIYQDFFGFVLWDFLPIDRSEIERIEVIRGPASAVWAPTQVGVSSTSSRKRLANSRGPR